ncbi:flagellar basal body P-ring formation chaperone FlgA [Stygiobacter electus]|uniref:Flagella basal body P-ring formation protein FlgA n=1 Tax=Stygiobacter electus TaxID=3032292 RepID=A0AAE3NYU4_9BACT|nr:flagellar basal body P-ring formation chaperone FlgA [Stygiobacter electus]MDF1611234.1 flagellar basal body P-ring formation chaperone FlgA [Stygiobacter electus]
MKNYLDKKLSNFEKYEFEIVSLPKKYLEIKIDEEKSFQLVKNFGYVPVVVRSANNNFQNSVITLKLKLFKKVFVTKKNIQSDELLNEKNLVEKLLDVSQLNGNTFSVTENINEFKSKVNLKENSVLLYEHLKKIPLVSKGNKIILNTGSNGVNISIEAVSRQDGYLGDIISIQAMNKIYKAKVIDKQNLELVNQ